MKIGIIGLGYVGLTLAVVAASKGIDVYGVETNQHIKDCLQKNKAHFYEAGLDNLIKRNNNKTFHVVDEFPTDIRFDAFIITVGTPLRAGSKEPNFEYIKSALLSFKKIYDGTQLIILRSTVSVGTTRRIVLPFLADMCKKSENIHVPACMNAMLTFLSLAIIFLDWNHLLTALGKWKALFLSMLSLTLSIVVIQNELESINIISSIRDKVFEFPVKMASIYDQNDTDVSPLPSSVTELIGDSTVCIYPWEISYCISTELNYVPLATLQAYCAYTPYLDRITAEKFLSTDAPEHIILSLDIIDNRWPLIECPQTWEAIRNNYFVLIEDNGIALLRHNDHAQPVLYESLGTLTQNIEDMIVLTDADYLKITAELNWKGKLAKMFWKIPEVNMTVYYSDENAADAGGRVLLDLFSEGVEVGSIVSPYNTAQLIDMINHEGNLSTVNSLCFSGDGLAYYNKNISIEFFRTSKNG